MYPLMAIACGMLVGLGVMAAVIGWRRRPEHMQRQQRAASQMKQIKRFRTRSASLDTQMLMGLVLAVLCAFGAYAATGWPVATLLGAGTGIIAPRMVAVPRERRAVADEIEAYSQWTEQIRDLVSVSGSLFEAVRLSAPNSPPQLRPQVTQLATLAGTVGLQSALTWFAARMKSAYADRLVLGMTIAWDSGSRVTEAFERVARAMRIDVEMRRRNEVANARVWTQVISIVSITVISVVLMFTFNRGFFDPFSTVIGQVILLAVGVMIFGNILWVLQLSTSGKPVRLLDQAELEAQAADLVALAEAEEAAQS